MSNEKTTRTKLAFTKAVKRAIFVAAALGILGGFPMENASAHDFVYGGGVVISVGNYCPPGTHLGYLGKHCWSNYRYYGPAVIGYGFPHIWHRRVIEY